MQNNIQQINLKIGDYEICPLPNGIFGLDGGAMFGTVPKILWEKQIPADDKNRIPMEARGLLLKSPTHNVVIDTGNGGDFIIKYGEKLGGKFSEMYNLSGGNEAIHKNLAKYGLAAHDITDVILTHLHFDHAGGATEANARGELVPTFANAKYYIQKQNLMTARDPNIREKASYFAANFEPLLKSNCVTLLDGSTENLLPGISVLISDGHTVGQQLVKITDGQQSLLYCGDLIPTSAHVRLPWVMGYDLNPLLLIQEKDELLKQAAKEEWFLFFEHDPNINAAKIQQQGTDYSVSLRFNIG